MSDRERECTLRIMEALSGVEEELLERCEEAGVNGKAGRKQRAQSGLRRYRRIAGYGSLCAACLCVILIGAVCRKGFPPGNNMAAGQSGDGSSVLIAESMEIAAEDMGEMEITAEDSSELQCEGETEDGTAADKAVFAEPDWIDIAGLFAVNSSQQSEVMPAESISQQSEMSPLGSQRTEQSVTEDGKSTENGAEDRINSDGDDVKDVYTDLSGTEDEKEKKMESAENGYLLNASAEWEKVCVESGLNRYVPSRLPDSYSRLEAKRGENADGGNFLLLCWSDGEHALWMKFTETKLDPEAVYTWEPPVFNAGEEWQSRTLKPGEDGSIRFAVLYGDGVLAEYAGWLTEEEVAELLRKIGSPAE